MFLFSPPFVLLRRWQFPGYAFNLLLVNHFNISFVEGSDDSNTELGYQQRHGRMVPQY